MSVIDSSNSKLLSHTILSEPQQLAIDRLYNYDETLLIAPTGAGKTVITLTAIAELLKDQILSRVLVVAPLKVCETAWRYEAAKWEHLQGLTIEICTGGPALRLIAVLSSADIVVINEENLPWLMKNWGPRDFDGLVIDEVAKWGDPGGERFKSIRKHLPKFQWRLGMTALPVSENWINLYGQCLIVDCGKALGRDKSKYLRTHFYANDWEGHDWQVLPTHHEIITEKIKPLVHVVPDTKAVDLPECRTTLTYLDMPECGAVPYHRMRIDSMLTLTDPKRTVEKPNAAALSGALEQLANGFLYLPNDKPGEAVSRDNRDWITTHHIKVRWILERLQSIQDDGENVIIVYWYQADLHWLREMLPYALELDGDLGAVLKKWNAYGGQALLLHPASAGHGIDGLQFSCHRQLWVSPIWSRQKQMQAIDRIWRTGQTHEVEIEIALARGTIDEVKLASVEGKGTHHELFMAHIGRDLT